MIIPVNKKLQKRFYSTIVDNDDYEKVIGIQWYLNGHGYAMAHKPKSGRAGVGRGNKLVFLHHLIMGRKEGFVVDHINRNPLDNRKANLRFITQAENMINSKTRVDSTSGTKGVSFCPQRGNWHVYINRDKKRINYWFKTKLEAIIKRKELEDTYHKIKVSG